MAFAEAPARMLQAGVLVLALACRDTPTGANVHLTGSQLGPPFLIHGRILAPDGGSICNALVTPAAQHVARLFDSVTATLSASQVVTCPVDTFALQVTAPGPFALAWRGATMTSADTLPDYHLETSSLRLTQDTARLDIHVRGGVPVPGGGTLDGNPVAGLVASTRWRAWPNGFDLTALTSTASGWSGRYVATRTPAILEAGTDYQYTCIATLLWGVMPTGPAAGTYNPATDPAGITCATASTRAIQMAHTASRLVANPLAGDLAGTEALSARFGRGFGVQYPVPVGTRPLLGQAGDAQMFTGGLIIALSASEVYSGINLAGYALTCMLPILCQDFGRSAVYDYRILPGGRKQVWWSYPVLSTANLPLLEVEQTSIDPSPGAGDFVLIRFRFRNTSPNPIGFYPGVLLDWDVNDDGILTNDVVDTALGGKVEYATDSSRAGVYVGTEILSHPAAGFRPFGASVGHQPRSLADQFLAMSGQQNQVDRGLVGDMRYYHSGVRIVLAAGAQEDFWMALIGGTSLTNLLQNAAAAELDYQVVRQTLDIMQPLRQASGSASLPAASLPGPRTKPAPRRSAGDLP